MYKQRPRKTGRSPMVSRRWNEGDRVVGLRGQENRWPGVFVRSYCTTGSGTRAAAYVVRCDKDGKERSFQHLVAG